MTKEYFRRIRERGQCVGCKKPSEKYRCADCNAKNNEYVKELRFRQSIERERRLELLEQTLAAEVRDLEIAHFGRAFQ